MSNNTEALREALANALAWHERRIEMVKDYKCLTTDLASRYAQHTEQAEAIRAVLSATECPSPTHERDGTGPESVGSDQIADANAPGRTASPPPSTEGLREALAPIYEKTNFIRKHDGDELPDSHFFGGGLTWGDVRALRSAYEVAFPPSDYETAFPQPDIEELIVAAYERGFQWCVENANDPEAAAYVGKAARDYADYTMNAPSAGVTAPQEVDG